jgi:hypothetical protein
MCELVSNHLMISIGRTLLNDGHQICGGSAESTANGCFRRLHSVKYLGSAHTVNRLDDIRIHTKTVAVDPILVLTRRSQDHHQDCPQIWIVLDHPQHFKVIHARHVQIEQHKPRIALSPTRIRIPPVQVVERRRPVARHDDLVRELILSERDQGELHVADRHYKAAQRASLSRGAVGKFRRLR